MALGTHSRRFLIFAIVLCPVFVSSGFYAALYAQEAGAHEENRPDELPKLSVVTLTASPAYPVPGESVRIEVSIRNTSFVTAKDLHSELFIDAKKLAEISFDARGGQTVTAKFDWKPSEARVYLITVKIDPENAVPQQDRIPNTATSQIIVAPKPAAGADLTIADLTLSEAPNQPLIANVTLKNQGAAAVGGPLVLKSGAQKISEVLVKPVRSGGRTTQNIPLPYGTDTDWLTVEFNPRFRKEQKHPEAALLVRDVRKPIDLRIESLSLTATPEHKGRPRRATVTFRIVNHGKEAVMQRFRTSIFPGDVDSETHALKPFALTSNGLAPEKAIYVSRSLVLPDNIHEFDAEIQVDTDQAIRSTTGHPSAKIHFQNPLPDVGRWYSIGPERVTDGLGAVGVLFSVALDPSFPNVIYVGSHGSGVWKTGLFGGIWFPLTDSLPSLKIAALTVDPAQSSRVFVATPDAGIFRSDDSGTTWSFVSDSVPLNLSDCCNTLIVDPNNPNSLYLSSFNGVYHSLDAGITWTLSLSAGRVHSFVLDKTGNRLFASVENDFNLPNTGVYELNLNATAWTQLSGCPLQGTLPTVSVPTQVTLSLSASTLYVAYRTKTTFQLYRSNGGCRLGSQFNMAFEPRWNPTGMTIGNPPQPIPTFLWNSIYSDPVDPNFVYATGTFLWRSTDGGATFDVPAGGPHADDHGFTATGGSPNTTLIVCDGGIFSSNDHGSSNSWQFIGTGITNVEFYDTTLAATDPSLLIGGTQDNGTELYSANTTGWNWPQIFDNDGATVAIDSTNAQIFYAMFQTADSISQSTGGGANWTNIAAGLPTGHVCDNTPFQLNPRNSSIILASCQSLWRTDSPGNPWTAIFSPPNENVSRSAVDPVSDVYFAGTNFGKIYAGPSGANWQLIFSSPFAGNVTDIQLDPTNSDFIYAGFSGSQAGRIYLLARSSPSALNAIATDITSNLPSGLQIRTLAVDPEFSHTVYAGTQAGVFRGQLPPGGSQWFWVPYNNGLPPAVIINRLSFHPTAGFLRAGSFGRSAFEVYTDSPFGGLVEVRGKPTLLRVNDVGTGYGPASDFLDVEAEVWLDTQPGRAFGFQLRGNSQEGDHQGMLKVLRDAIANNRTVQLDVIRTGVRNGRIIRVMELP